VALAACGDDTSASGPTGAALTAPREEPAAAETAAAPEVPAVNVELMRLIPQSLTVRANFVGNVAPWERVAYRAEVEGMVEAMRVDTGDTVARAQVLAEIDRAQLTLRRDLARSRLTLAAANLSRQEQLSAEQLISEATLKQSRNQRDVARYTLQVAELELQKSRVVAGTDGVIKTRAAEPGEFVSKGALLFEVLDMARMRVRFDVPEQQIGSIRRDMPAEVIVDALGGARLQGRVTTVGVEADSGSRSFPVEVVLDNPGRQLRAGMLARVGIETQRIAETLLVPRHALLEQVDGRIAYVVERDQAVQRKVRTGADRDGSVQVLSGLSAGERLVVRGQQKLIDGNPVVVRGENVQAPELPTP
jgi:membrane fusion protein (multidrug efflux system)